MIAILEKHKSKIAILALIITLFLLLKFLNPILFGGNVRHGYPVGYYAGDSYWVLADVKWTEKTGLYRQMPPNLVNFSKERYTTNEPPSFIYFGGAIGEILGIKAYDATGIAMTLLLVVGVLIMFAFLYEISPWASIPFLPYVLLMTTHPFSAVYTWGYWRQFFSITVLLLSIIFLAEKSSTKNSIILGILFAAVITSYPFYAIFFLLFVLIMGAMSVAKEKKIRSQLINAGITCAVAFAISLPYLIEYVASRSLASASNIISASLGSILNAAGRYNPYANVTFSHLWIKWALLPAVIIILIYLISKLRENVLTKANKSIFSLFSIFIISLLPSLMILQRAFQLRWLWPIIVGMLLSVAVYLLLSTFLRKQPIANLTYLVLFVLVAFAMGSKLSGNLSMQPGGLTSQTEWEAFEYVSAATPEDSEVFLADPQLQQGAISLGIDRPTRYLEYSDFVSLVANNKSLNEAESRRMCQYPARNLRNFRLEKIELPEECSQRNYPLCSFDYLVIRFMNDQGFVDWIGRQNLQKNFEVEKLFGDTLVLKNKGCDA